MKQEKAKRGREAVNGERRKIPIFFLIFTFIRTVDQNSYPYLGENRANPLPPICHNISLFLLQVMGLSSFTEYELDLTWALLDFALF